MLDCCTQCTLQLQVVAAPSIVLHTFFQVLPEATTGCLDLSKFFIVFEVCNPVIISVHGRYLYALLAVTVGAFVGAIALIGVSFYWFNPSGSGDCSFNVFVMTMTILLTLAVSLGSLHPQVSTVSSTAAASLMLPITHLHWKKLCQSICKLLTRQ